MTFASNLRLPLLIDLETDAFCVDQEIRFAMSSIDHTVRARLLSIWSEEGTTNFDPPDTPVP